MERKANNQFWNFFSIESRKHHTKKEESTTNESHESCRIRRSCSTIRETIFLHKKRSGGGKKKTTFIVPLFKVFCCAKLSCPIDDRTVSIQRPSDHEKALRGSLPPSLWSIFREAFYAKSHFCVLLFSGLSLFLMIPARNISAFSRHYTIWR